MNCRAGQGVLVRRDLLAGNMHQFWIAVAFFHVTEDLIVGAVFLDDVQDVLEDRRFAVPLRNGHRLGVEPRFFQAVQAVGEAIVGVDLRRYTLASCS